MKTPYRITLQEAFEQMVPYRSRVCPECGQPLQVVKAFISIHFIEFTECAGSGQVANLLIPYCPRCEPVPDQYGCVHVGYRGTHEA